MVCFEAVEIIQKAEALQSKLSSNTFVIVFVVVFLTDYDFSEIQPYIS